MSTQPAAPDRPPQGIDGKAFLSVFAACTGPLTLGVGGLVGILLGRAARRGATGADRAWATAGMALGAVTLVAGIGVAVVLIPNLGGVRGRFRRTDMADRLSKEHAAALAAVVERTGRLPAATVAADLPVRRRLAWTFSLLPYMPVARDWAPDMDPQAAWDAPPNARVTARPVQYFLDARDPAPGAVTQIVGMAGVGADAAALPPGDPNAGMFNHAGGADPADVPGGLGRTVLLVTAADRLGPWAQGGFSTVRGLSAQPYVGGPDGIGGPLGSTFALMADGTLREFTPATDPAVLRALATKAAD